MNKTLLLPSAKLAALLWPLLLLMACQPDAAERMQRAEVLAEDGDYRAAIIELKNVLRDESNNQRARELLAKSSYQIADFSTAEIEYRRALDAGGDSLEAWLGLGKSLMEQGRVSEAFESVVPHLAQYDDSIAAHVLVGDVLAALGNFEEAAAEYEAAAAIDEKSELSLIGLAVVASALGETERARVYLATATSEHPDSDIAWRASGNFERLHGNYAVADEHYQRAIANETAHTPDSDRFMTRMNRTTVLLDTLKNEAARRQLNELQAEFGRHPLLLYLRGRLAFGEGDYDVAQSSLQEYLSRAPNDLRGQAVMGAVNFAQNYLRQAEMYLQQAARQNVGGDVTRRLLAETQLRLNKPEEALQSLGPIDDDSLEDPILLTMLGRAELGRGNNAQAIEYLEKSVAADPDNPNSHLSLVAGLLAAGDNSRAIAALQNVPAHDDPTYRRESLLMAAYLRSGNREAAVAESDKLVAAHSDDSQAHAVAGLLRHSIGDNGPARAHYEKAVELNASNLPALYGLGRITRDAGDLREAREWLNRALDVDPVFGAALAALAQVATRENDYLAVAPRLTAATKQSPSVAPLWILHARTAISNGRSEEALKIIEAAREFHRNDPQLTHVEGLALLRSGQTEAALKRLSLAADGLPDDPRVHLDLAKARLGTGDYRGTQTAIARYRRLRPEDASGLSVETESLVRGGNPAEARKRLAAFGGFEENDPLQRVLAGDIEMLDGKPAAAVVHYEAAAASLWSRQVAIRLSDAYRQVDPAKSTATLERWLKDNPDDVQMRRALGQTLEAAGDTTAAARQYELLVAEGSADPIVLNNLAWRYAEEGRPGAVDLAERASNLWPDNGSISDTYGWILYKDGQKAKAIGVLERAVRQSPDNPEIRFHLAQVQADLGRAAQARESLKSAFALDKPFPSMAAARSLAESL